MPNLTSVNVTNGIPDSGTGTVSTIDALLAALVAGTTIIGAGGNLIGRASASLETSTIYNATTALTPKFAKISITAAGDNTLVAAVSAKKIRVLAYIISGSDAVNVKFQSGAAGTDLTGLKYISASGGCLVAPFNPVGWFETASNTLLNLNVAVGIIDGLGGELVYVEV